MITNSRIDLGEIKLKQKVEFEIPYDNNKDVLNYFSSCGCLSVRMVNGKLTGSQTISKIPKHLKEQFISNITRLPSVKKVVVNYRDGSADIIEIKTTLINDRQG